MNPSGKKIVLGVTGSIAAYKALELLRLLVKQGHGIWVVQTPASRHFIAPLSFQALSGHPVVCDQFELGAEASFAHIELTQADLMVVAPASANTIGKMALGLADNLLLSAYLAADCPVLVAPAMNQRMWRHPALQKNLNRLIETGVAVVAPGSGELACGEVGEGRMAEPWLIQKKIQELIFPSKQDFAGRRVLVTAGGTQEPIDAVRFITNRSSGKMGFALAEAARERGAAVTVVAANCSLPRHPEIHYINVHTAAELEKALEKEVDACDVLFMAAAVSDYMVSSAETTGKIERQDKINLQLVPTSDIVSALGRKPGNSSLIVGFAAEYGAERIERARAKLERKNLDLIVFNDISRADIGFESDDNEITILAPGREDLHVDKATKRECAGRILDQVDELLG